MQHLLGPLRQGGECLEGEAGWAYQLASPVLGSDIGLR